MLRIRFDEEGVKVMLDDGGRRVDLSEKYDKVEVDFMHRKGFWCRLGNPLTGIRVAAHLNAAVFLLRGDKGEEGRSDGV